VTIWLPIDHLGENSLIGENILAGEQNPAEENNVIATATEAEA